MFKTGNFLFRREIIHYTNWQNLCRDKYPKARGWQNLCREESRQRGAGRTSAGRNPNSAGPAEPLPGGIQTARSWQNLCREESRRREAGRISAGRNPNSAELAEPLPGRIPTARSWQNLCRDKSGQRGAGRTSAGKNPNGAELAESLPGRIPTARGWKRLCRDKSGRRGAGRISAGRNQRGFGQTRGLSLHEGANQCVGILIFHLSLPRAHSGGTPACRDRPRVCPPPSVRQGRNKHVIRQTPNDCECIRLPRDDRTDTGKNPRGYRTDTGSVPAYGNESMWVSGGQQITPRGSVSPLSIWQKQFNLI